LTPVPLNSLHHACHSYFSIYFRQFNHIHPPKSSKSPKSPKAVAKENTQMTSLPQKNIKSNLPDEDDFDYLMADDIFDTGKRPEIDVEFDKYEVQYAVGANALNKRVLGWFRDSAVQSYENGKYQEAINYCNMGLEKGMVRYNYYTGVFDMIVGLCSEQLMLYHQALDRYSNALLQFKEFEQEENDKIGKAFCERQVSLIEDRLRFIRAASSRFFFSTPYEVRTEAWTKFAALSHQ